MNWQGEGHALLFCLPVTCWAMRAEFTGCLFFNCKGGSSVLRWCQNVCHLSQESVPWRGKSPNVRDKRPPNMASHLPERILHHGEAFHTTPVLLTAGQKNVHNIEGTTHKRNVVHAIYSFSSFLYITQGEEDHRGRRERREGKNTIACSACAAQVLLSHCMQ